MDKLSKIGGGGKGGGGGKDPMGMVKGIVGKVMKMVEQLKGGGSTLNKMGNGMMG